MVQTDVFHALYWAIGDSGNQLDDSLQAQNKSTLHGSIVRISVDSNMGDEQPRYLIPEGNPFKNGGALRLSPGSLPRVVCESKSCKRCSV